MTAITDALGIERFFTVGWSGGGPHALACAALLPERVIAAATIASVAPRDAEGLDWLDGMGQENLDEFAAAQAGEEQLLGFIEPFRAQLESVSSAQIYEAFGDLLSEVDLSALSGEFAEYFADATRTGLQRGVYGWYDDDLAMIRDLGFRARRGVHTGHDLAGSPGPDGAVRARRSGWRRTCPEPARRLLPDHVSGR